MSGRRGDLTPHAPAPCLGPRASTILRSSARRERTILGRVRRPDGSLEAARSSLMTQPHSAPALHRRVAVGGNLLDVPPCPVMRARERSTRWPQTHRPPSADPGASRRSLRCPLPRVLERAMSGLAGHPTGPFLPLAIASTAEPAVGHSTAHFPADLASAPLVWSRRSVASFGVCEGNAARCATLPDYDDRSVRTFGRAKRRCGLRRAVGPGSSTSARQGRRPGLRRRSTLL